MIEEYPIINQFHTTGFSGYVIFSLLIISTTVSILSWFNYFKMKNSKVYGIIQILLPVLLVLSIWNIFLNTWTTEQEVIAWSKRHNFGDVPSPLFLAGYYVAKLIPRFTLILTFVVCLGYLPLLLNKSKTKKAG